MDTCAISDFEKVCRICMKFDKTFLSITSFKIIDMIITCASVQIWENDDLPNQICQTCFLQLQNSINFKQLCENSDHTFRQIIQQNKINSSNNQNDFHKIKHEDFEDYADDHSPMDIKEEEDMHENISENLKISTPHSEDGSRKKETNSMLEIKNKDKQNLNGLQVRIKSEEESDACENIKHNKNIIEAVACEKCNKKFKKLWVLGLHMQRKHRAKALKCNKCEIKCYHPLHLQQHQEMMHIESNLTCNKCNKVLSNIYELKRHKLIHLKQKSIQCQRCDKSFDDKLTLKHHYKEIHALTHKCVTCHICGKSIKKKSLKNHLTTHKDREKITCDKCSKTFISQLTLKIHIREVHSNQIRARNHLCNICGYASRSAADLRKHLLIHSNERPYSCDRCDKTYRRPDYLKRHISHAHLNERKFQCSFCSQAFHEKRHLVHHERRHTGEKPHKCEVCDKGFAQKIAMKIHMKIHTNSKENLIQS